MGHDKTQPQMHITVVYRFTVQVDDQYLALQIPLFSGLFLSVTQSFLCATQCYSESKWTSSPPYMTTLSYTVSRKHLSQKSHLTGATYEIFDIRFNIVCQWYISIHYKIVTGRKRHSAHVLTQDVNPQCKRTEQC